MWQVRVWWAGWMEIASGPECVFMSSCQSTDRPLCPISQAQVWWDTLAPAGCSTLSRSKKKKTHTQTHTINHEKSGNGDCLCENYHLQCDTASDEDFRMSDKVRSCGKFSLKYAFSENKTPSTCCRNGARPVGIWKCARVTHMQELLCLGKRRVWSAVTCLVFCWSKLNSRSAGWILDRPDKKGKRQAAL